MVTYDKTKPFLKKIPTITDVTDRVQRFGLDNLYPQRCEEVAKNSYTLSSVLGRYSDFINGEGFEDAMLKDLKVNDIGLFGQTFSDVLNDISVTYASWNTIAVHVNYNMNLRICSIMSVPFSFCRFGLLKDGKVKDIMYSTNWEHDGRRELKLAEIISFTLPSLRTPKRQKENGTLIIEQMRRFML